MNYAIICAVCLAMGIILAIAFNAKIDCEAKGAVAIRPLLSFHYECVKPI